MARAELFGRCPRASPPPDAPGRPAIGRHAGRRIAGRRSAGPGPLARAHPPGRHHHPALPGAGYDPRTGRAAKHGGGSSPSVSSAGRAMPSRRDNERVIGQPRRSRDTLRGGVAVSRRKRFAAWATDRTIPFRGGGGRCAIACLVLARQGEDAALARTLRSLAAQDRAPAGLRIAWDEAPPAGTDAIRWDPQAPPPPSRTGPMPSVSCGRATN